MYKHYDELYSLLSNSPNSKQIVNLVEKLENTSDRNSCHKIDLLKGVWELKWSSSKLPFLKYSPFYENLQILNPPNLNGMNLIKPNGINAILGTVILLNLRSINDSRIGVEFTHGGIIGPKLFAKELNAFKKFKKTQKGWLDITYLNEDIRICRGDKGTIFVLLRKKNDILFRKFSEFSINYTT
tara:strand:- start:173 stop:724 length:552 start_codon:yes stop_codon:yes gene_type:complete